MSKKTVFLRKYLFRRVVLIIFALLLQLAAFIAVILRFNDYIPLFYAGSIFVSIAAVLIILDKKSNPAYKMAWIIPILLFPIFGGLFYIFFGGNKMSRRSKRKMKQIFYKTHEVLIPQKMVLDGMESISIIGANQARYIQEYCGFPPYHNTFCEYLPIGETKFSRLKEELKKAEHFIFLEYFIIEEGLMWNSILNILVEKVREGVDVRVIYDDAGCLLTLPYRYDRKLEEMGIKCCIFNPILPLLTSRINNRDHRKIAIIDGHTGFTGGINLADEYINQIQKYGHWKDSGIMLKGESVWSMTVMFLTMWEHLRGTDENLNNFRSEVSSGEENGRKGYVQPFADSPLDDEPVGQIVYLNLINKATRYVYITTPYLIIDNEIVTALTAAAKGGVDIRIITPHIADKWYVHIVTQSYYKSLVESGVKIYEYSPGFIHSKTFVSDDAYGVVGTINMDYRSLYLHFECAVWMFNNPALVQMKNDFMSTLTICKEITKADLRHSNFFKTLIGTIMRVFAPFM